MDVDSVNTQKTKSPTLTLLLCLFLGLFGIHRLYVGKFGTAFLMLITLGGLGIWYLVDLILIVSNKFEDKQGNVLKLTNNASSTKKNVMITGAVVAWFLVFFGTIFAVALFLTSNLINPVAAQLKYLQSGDFKKAYSYTSKDFQKATSLDNFKKFLNQYPSLKNNESYFFNEREIQNNVGFLRGTLTSKDGAKTPIMYRLIWEDGAWKIMGFQLLPVGPGETIKDNEKDASNHNEDMKLFENKKNKYSIKYPSSWQYKNTEKGTVLFRGKDGTPSYFTTVNIQTIRAKKIGGKYSTAKELADALVLQLDTPSLKANVLKRDEIELPTNPKKFHGESLIITYNYKQHEFKQLQVIILRDDGLALYTWAYTAPAKLFDSNLPLAKAMYESWTIE